MKEKKDENLWFQDIIKEEIVSQTNFEKSKIVLIASKRLQDNIPNMNYHKFKYENQLYILSDGKLKVV